LKAIKVAMALRLELGFHRLFFSKKSEFQTLDDVEKAFPFPPIARNCIASF